ncbi:MAG: hypothetical protein Q4A00_07730 [Flavobacteriaceae bacterium]|nr:hypothetical protein [Flavobacteriaceae bacterium]
MENTEIEDLELKRKINYFLENFQKLVSLLLDNNLEFEKSVCFFSVPDSKYNYFIENIDNFYNKFNESYNDLFL